MSKFVTAKLGPLGTENMIDLDTACCNSSFRISVFTIATYYPFWFYTEKAAFDA